MVETSACASRLAFSTAGRRRLYREGKNVRKRTLLNLTDWPAEHVEGLRGVLKGGVVVPAGQEAFTVQRTLPHGHVAAVLGAARAIGLDRRLGPKTKGPRHLAMTMIVSRIMAPASKLATAKALDPTTVASSLGVELDLGEVDETDSMRRLIGCMSVRERSSPRSPSGI